VQTASPFVVVNGISANFYRLADLRDTMRNWATSRSTTPGRPDAAEVTSYP
jgi:hypothetical protein